jgi:hypothetical protein
MRGTLLDNESTRRRGIREMKEASNIRTIKKKRDAEHYRVGGKPPVRPKLKQPWLRLSFLRNRPKPVVPNNRHGSSTAVVQQKPSKSHSKHHSSQSPDKKHKKKPPYGVSRTRKRSTAHKRSGGSAKRGNKK